MKETGVEKKEENTKQRNNENGGGEDSLGEVVEGGRSWETVEDLLSLRPSMLKYN